MINIIIVWITIMQANDEGLVLAQKFRILKKVGSGSFGYIYICKALIM